MSRLTLSALPVEILTEISRLLTYHDRAHLTATCTQINELVQPLLWTNIEFHGPGYHESSYELNEPPPYIPVHERAYQELSLPKGRNTTAQYKAECFVTMLQDYHETDQKRLQTLCSRVKHFCTGVDSIWGRTNRDGKQKPLFWHILPFFKNLETLELHGENFYNKSMSECMTEDMQEPPLQKLRFAKLFAYIPPQVARWILKSGATLERLELGLLDRPISTNLSHNPEFLPLPEENLNSDSDDDAEPDYGSLCGENVIPRPLGGIVTDDMSLDLPNLKVLYLCSPADSPHEGGFMEYTFSSRAEKASLSDWKRLLLASSQSLETLVLEHRPGAEYIEGDGVTSVEYLQYNDDGRINRKLVTMVEKLLKDENSFPSLKSVYLYGIEVGKDFDVPPSHAARGFRLMPMLKRRGVHCEARRGKWCYFDSNPGYTFWCQWDGDDGDSDEEADEERWDTVLAEV